MNRSPLPQTDTPRFAPAKNSGDYKGRRPAWIWLLALVLLGTFCLFSTLFWQLFNPPQASGFLGIGLLSKRVADYSADPRSLSFPLKEASFLGDILRDKDPHAADLPGRLATLETVLDEPIPIATTVSQGLPPPSDGATPTSRPGQTSSPNPTLTIAGTLTLTPTQTLASMPTPTFTQTLTGMPTPTITLTRTVTITATPTCAPSTSATNNCTPTPTLVLKASPTQTRTPNPAVTVPVKPTLTPTQTATKVTLPSKTLTYSPTATATQPPVTIPTDTYTPVPINPPTETPTARPVIFPTVSTCNSVPANSLAAAADSYVDRTRPDTNYGSAASLFIRPSAGVDKRALVRFDLSSIPPGSQVQAAILYVYNNKGNTYAVSVLRVTEPWDEMGVTWNNQPAADTGSAAGSFKLTSDVCTRGTYVSSALIQGWVNDPGSNYGVMLYPPSGAGDVDFSSREGSNPPQLFVVYQ